MVRKEKFKSIYNSRLILIKKKLSEIKPKVTNIKTPLAKVSGDNLSEKKVSKY